jgi:hypothetical protein
VGPQRVCAVASDDDGRFGLVLGASGSATWSSRDLAAFSAGGPTQLVLAFQRVGGGGTGGVLVAAVVAFDSAVVVAVLLVFGFLVVEKVRVVLELMMRLT